ncbi:MAG: hypothetical protein WAN65_10825 [Candidatus Sulfotelmatobacter sp.]
MCGPAAFDAYLHMRRKLQALRNGCNARQQSRDHREGNHPMTARLTDAAAQRLKDFIATDPMAMTYGSWLDLKADLRTLLSEREVLLASHAALVEAATMTERLTGTTPEARAAIEAARTAARAARGPA